MTRTRDPDKTRRKILEAAFKEMYQVGYQAASLDRILKEAGVTKGALYHHFRGKLQMGHAVVDELIAGFMLSRWAEPLSQPGDPIVQMKDVMSHVCDRDMLAAMGNVVRGCPLNNLAQEMSSVDEGFRQRISHVFNLWRESISNALQRGQSEGMVRDDIQPDQTAGFIVAMIEGSAGVAKNEQSLESLKSNFDMIGLFPDGLRPQAQLAA